MGFRFVSSPSAYPIHKIHLEFPIFICVCFQWLLEFKRQEGHDLKAARCAFLTQARQEHILSNLLRTPRPRETRTREDFASSLEEADPSGEHFFLLFWLWTLNLFFVLNV
jgi:hypothetical protein